MASENQLQPLRVPAPSFDVASAHRPLKVLSLTGGGYRGLFTAQVLVELCDRAPRPGRLDHSFDVFGGTSIGGLMACALAVGVPPRRVLDAIDVHGPLVFVKKRKRTLRRVFFGTLYDSDNLAKAIDDCLGRAGRTKLKNIDASVAIPAVDWAKGTVQLFLSGAFGKPHVIDGAVMLDGGLAANNPDTLILLEVAKRWPERFARTQMLSIGTAGADPVRAPEQADKTGLGWASDLAVYMMGVQERTAAAQAQRLLGAKRYLRINHQPTQQTAAFEQLDLATDEARTVLLDAATSTAWAAYRSNRTFVDRVLAQRPGHQHPGPQGRHGV